MVCPKFNTREYRKHESIFTHQIEWVRNDNPTITAIGRNSVYRSNHRKISIE